MDKQIISFRESRFLLPETDPYRVHQYLARLFNGNRMEKHYIYRSDLVVGKSLVQLRTSIEDDIEGLSHKTYTVGNDDLFHFKLRCVPLQRENHKIVKIYRDFEAEEWLEKRALVNGFELKELNSAISNPLVFSGKNRRKIIINESYLEGVLRVTNIEKFEKALKNGLGRNKGFGFGMLIIKEGV